jgi:hypothetical protein
VSLATVASPTGTDPVHAALPPSRPERFQASDWIAAAFVFVITLGVYIATLAPSVTLEDSGELITGAYTFGVPHPPGYPLWTMSGWLICHLVPFGNIAWRLNLQSALFGAAANAVLTLLVCHSGRWLVQRWAPAELQAATRHGCFYVGMFAGLVLGFSDIMWSQGVIAEVYTLNGLFVNLTLLLFYLWMLEPRNTQRLVVTVLVFALGLTNHHTLIQMIPAILVAAVVVRAGKFWSVFLAINLFSLSVLAYLSWLSVDGELYLTCYRMAVIIFGIVLAVSFFYLRDFRLNRFMAGAFLAVAFFAYGHYFFSRAEDDTARHWGFHQPPWLIGSYVHPGWLQITTGYGVALMGLAAAALGVLFSSSLDKRLIIGVFAAGWVGLMPYYYERVASSTDPPMNWGDAALRSGFYYAVTRQQYPMSLPNLIKDTMGKLVRAVPRNEEKDVALDQPDYFHRMWLTLYYYGDNLQDNFTVPLIFLALAVLLYLRRCDWPQAGWFIFLAVAFVFLGFMLHLISPPVTFDFQANDQYKVFNLQSHCIFVLVLAYGLIAALIYLQESLPEAILRLGVPGIGAPALFLALLPLWSNFDDGNQAGHWFGWQFGTDIMRGMDRNAVYFGGSDYGRFVPTYMAFCESFQSPRWKRDPTFDRRDVIVITQNALCDTYYTNYIRQQYDPRFRPKTWTPFEKWLGRDHAYPPTDVACMSDEELNACWAEYDAQPEVAARIKQGGPRLRPGSDDVFALNGVVAWHIFQENKAHHTFYLEQSVAMPWTYLYLIPDGLIFRLSPDPLKGLTKKMVDDDRTFWDAYAARLLADPHFRTDDDATLTFGKLAYWHGDLYRHYHMEAEEEHWFQLSRQLSPQLAQTIEALCNLYVSQKRFDLALSVVRQARIDDPRNETYAPLENWIIQGRDLRKQDVELVASLKKNPYDLDANLAYARVLYQQGRDVELKNQLYFTAGLNNISHSVEAGVVGYYAEQMHAPDDAAAFLRRRVELDPGSGQRVYALAALEASAGENQAALYDLAVAAQIGGSNALVSARIDPRFANLQDDPRFRALVAGARLESPTNAPPVNPVKHPATPLPPARNFPATNAPRLTHGPNP